MWECSNCSFQNYAALQQCTRCGDERPGPSSRRTGLFAAAFQSLFQVPFLYEYPVLGLLTIFFRLAALVVTLYGVWSLIVTLVMLFNARGPLGFLIWFAPLSVLLYAAVPLAAAELICLAVKGVAYLRQIAQNTLPR